MLGAIPVPLYADAVAEEIASVLEIAGAKMIVAQDQEQVDKMASILARLPAVAHVLYEEPRGLDDYDERRLRSLDEVIASGRKRLEGAEVARALDALIEAGRGDDPSVILFTSGTTGRSKGVVLIAGRAIVRGARTSAFDRLTDRDEVLAYLPLAWVGDHYLNYAQGSSQASASPARRARRRARGLARDRPDLPFRAAACVRVVADAGFGPHGGRERVQALDVRAFHG